MEKCPNHNYSRQKIGVILSAFALLILFITLGLIFGERSIGVQAFSLIAQVCLNFLVFAWCSYDALEKNNTLNKIWRYVLIFTGQLGLIIYLFNSRGFVRGLVSTGKYLLLLLGMVLGTLIIGVALFILLELFKRIFA